MQTIPANEPLRAPEAGGVTVRMYGQGLGDCFLLAFGAKDQATPFTVLIDSGAVFGTPEGADRMHKITENIKRAVDAENGGAIDLLIVTHEHWDHVSGFLQAETVWSTIEIRRVWMAWTEDPDDPLGKALKTEYRNLVTSLRMAALRAEEPEKRADFNTVVALLGDPFAAKAEGPLPGDKFSTQTHEALEKLRARTEGRIEYRQPGEVRPLAANLPLATAYVLGPPRDRKTLRNMNPRGAEAFPREEETIAHLAEPLSLSEQTAFTLALGAAGESEDEESAKPRARTPEQAREESLRELAFPFDRHLRIPWSAAMRHPYFVRRYGFSAPYPGAEEVGPEWRRINDDWLGSAERLALQMDSYTNNTSLALAIELPRTRKILLFPADAQAGSWLSWDGIAEWKDEEGKKVPATVADLLARTVFYKVGHHGSHNATMRATGLDRMALHEDAREDLVAFVPVSVPVAHQIQRWTEMPLPSLIAALEERCKGRVVLPNVESLGATPPGSSDAATWSAFCSRLGVADVTLGEKRKKGVVIEKEVPLFVQYPIED